jgi:hypothetical protein
MKKKFLATGAYCECGRKLQDTGDGYYVLTQYHNDELIFAKCNHGVVVIDKRDLSQKLFPLF